ncbi:MAG: hypothetical protein JNJ54_02945 [Myxococcaceae bacterium]|nr:hypothetical protein [Myxococcaceae bacterium]
MTDTAQPRPTGAAITAALSAFMGGPVALAIFALALGPGGEGGLAYRLASAWREGGWPMYLVLLVGGLVATACAVCMFFGVQRGSLAVLACPPLSALITATGAFGFFTGMRGALGAIAHVSPADRATILAAGTSEALSCSAFGMAGTAGLIASLALGCLFGVVAQTGATRKLLAFSGVTFLVLGLVSGAALQRLGDVMGLFKALAFAAPVDRLTILVAGSEELDARRLPLLALLAVLGLVLVAGAAMLKDHPRAAVLVPLLGLGGVAGLGVQALARASIDRSATPPAGLKIDTAKLIELPGYASFEGATRCLGPKTVGDCLEGDDLSPDALRDELAAIVRREAEEADLRGLARKGPDVPVAVQADASATSLWRFIDAAIAEGAGGVELLGQQASGPQRVVSELAVLEQAFRSDWRGVSVGLVREAERCRSACEFASVQGQGLLVGAETWKPGRLSGERTPDDEVLLRADRSLTPQALATLALAAASHGRRLVLVLPTE